MIKILYIEDNIDDSHFLCSLASQIKEFAPIVSEQTLKKGLEKIQKLNFDCVFLDLSLPDTFGLETIEIVKKALPQAPIIVFTGMNDQETALQAINRGAQDFLIKGEITLKLLKKSVFYALEMHKNEQELNLARYNLTKVESLAKMGHWEYYVKSKKIEFSNGMASLLGLNDSSQVCSLEDYFKYLKTSDLVNVKSNIAKCIKTQKPIIYLSDIQTVDGLNRLLETSIECRKNDFGEPESIFAAIIDVTKSRKSEFKFKESEEKLLEAQELAKIGNWEYDFRQEEFSGSPEAYKIFDLVSEDGINHNAKDVINEMTWGSDSVRIYKTITEHFESKEPFSIEFKIGTRKGNIKNIKATAKIFNNADNSGKKMRGTVQDITTLKEAEEMKKQFTRKLESEVKERTSELTITKIKLEESLEKEKELGDLKSRFVSTASHQFRTPLTVIQSSIGLLDMHLEKAPENLKSTISKTSERIRNEVKRMINIMNDVLVLGKIEASKVLVHPVRINPANIIKSVIKSHNEIQTDGRKAKLINNGRIRTIELDPNLFEHVISNLLSNAFKYSKEKKAPQIIIDFKTKKLSIEVVDFGLGIPREEINSVFEPFFRASNVNQISGTGLGTTIIKEYVELMEGSISLESQVNKGSNFKIEFKK